MRTKSVLLMLFQTIRVSSLPFQYVLPKRKFSRSFGSRVFDNAIVRNHHGLLNITTRKLSVSDSNFSRDKKPANLYQTPEVNKQENSINPPFSDEILGTYTCHGMQPYFSEQAGLVRLKKKINQDRGCIVYPFRSKKDEALIVVLDGHGGEGEKVSEFAMNQIANSLEEENLDENPLEALKTCFLKTEKTLKTQKIENIDSGSTCVTCYIRGKKIYVANIGDSRAVKAKLNDDGTITAVDMSRDHKPDDPDEKKRITEKGGFVEPPPEVGYTARVYLDPKFKNGGLAMSRAFGDFYLKSVGVIAEPEVKVFDVDDNDEFLIIASDGIWEFISSQEAVEIVQKTRDQGLHKATIALMEVASSRWLSEGQYYRDDITALVLKLPLMSE